MHLRYLAICLFVLFILSGCRIDKQEFHNPQWLAGTWKKKQDKYTPIYDTKTGKPIHMLISFNYASMHLWRVIERSDYRYEVLIDDFCLREKSCYGNDEKVYYQPDDNSLLVVSWNAKYFPGSYSRYKKIDSNTIVEINNPELSSDDTIYVRVTFDGYSLQQ